MTLKRLVVTGLRNLKAVDILLSPELNVFYGDNGSGKTSILEALSILSLGRSFRSPKYKTMINYEVNSYTVFGNIISADQVPVSVGIQRSKDAEAVIKKAGQKCSSAAELAELLPIRILNGHCFAFLEGSPKVRRQFLDWLVFHVEHGFYEVWRKYEKCLKQRNSIIRRGKIDRLLLDSWEAEMAPLGEQMAQMRKVAFDFLQHQFNILLGEFTGLEDVCLKFSPGWDTTTPLAELLETNRQRDMDLGYTLQGPHRYDVKIYQGKHPALEVLSRGQQKIVISALYIAQGMVLKSQLNRRCVYLIDDLPAELDSLFRQKLASWLVAMQSQVCVTGVELKVLLEAWQVARAATPPLDIQVFHVEHGEVRMDKRPELGWLNNIVSSTH